MKLAIHAYAAVLASISITALAQDAVQWRVEDGGNGHWYLGVVEEHSWIEAITLAETSGGYLATPVTQAEHEFLLGTCLADPGMFFLNWGPHIGGFQDVDAPDFEEPGGGWRWTTGEPFDWQDWGGCGPDNYGGNQNNLQYAFCHNGASPVFNDVGADYTGVETPSFIIEWSADCNDDGIVDYGQILDGTFEDIDGNGVPDCCEGGGSCDRGPVQWRIEDGGNGHWYAGIGSGEITWLDAQQEATAAGGHLVTITDEAEDGFVRLVVAEDTNLWMSDAIRGPYFGGFQVSDQDCEWRWVNGDLWGYTNWYQGNPDGPCPQGLQFWSYQARQWQDNWKDDPTRAIAYLVEWDADCNDDGIVDYGQILDGTYEDLDGNGIPDCCEGGGFCDCRVDLTEDGEVNTLDFLLYLGAWSQRDPLADWDGNGTVNTLDFLVYLNDWVEGC